MEGDKAAEEGRAHLPSGTGKGAAGHQRGVQGAGITIFRNDANLHHAAGGEVGGADDDGDAGVGGEGDVGVVCRRGRTEPLEPPR